MLIRKQNTHNQAGATTRTVVTPFWQLMRGACTGATDWSLTDCMSKHTHMRTVCYCWKLTSHLHPCLCLRASGLRRERVSAGEQDLHRHQPGGFELRYHLRLCQRRHDQLEPDGRQLHRLHQPVQWQPGFTVSTWALQAKEKPDQHPIVKSVETGLSQNWKGIRRGRFCSLWPVWCSLWCSHLLLRLRGLRLHCHYQWVLLQILDVIPVLWCLSHMANEIWRPYLFHLPCP